MEDFINNMFTRLDSEESIAFVIFMLLSFLLGFIIAAVAYGLRARKLRKELKRLEGDFSTLRAEHEVLKEQMDLKEADLIRAEREAEDAVARAKNLEKEKEDLDTEILTLTDLNDKYKISVQSYGTTIEDLQNQILGLKTRNQQLTTESKEEGEAMNQLMQMQSSYNATVNRLAAVEEKLNELSTENKNLKGELETVKTSTEESLAAVTATVSEHHAATEKQEVSAEDQKIAAINALGATLPMAGNGEQDDLTLIKGIGTNLEKQLNGLGIYTYKQISQFDEDTIDKVTTAISFFPGRIKRDDWVGQATRLMEIKAEDPAALNPSAVFPDNPEDLKIVEGIGPKIEKLLKDAGVNTWADLASSDVEKLKAVLNKAGSRYQIHDPSTWPMQAQKAVDGQWEELKEYQDFLVGGKVKQ